MKSVSFALCPQRFAFEQVSGWVFALLVSDMGGSCDCQACDPIPASELGEAGA